MRRTIALVLMVMALSGLFILSAYGSENDETLELIDGYDYTLLLVDGWEVAFELGDYIELRNYTLKPSDCIDDEAIISFQCRLNGSANEKVAECIEQWPDFYKQIDNFICNGVEYLRVIRTGGRIDTNLYTSYGIFDPDSKGYIEIHVNSIEEFELFLPLLETMIIKQDV